MTISSTSKTLARGLAKTRSGSPSIGIQELIEKTRQSGFADRIKKAVSEDEALDAAKRLSEGRKSRVRRYAEGGVIGGLVNPALRAAGRGVEAVVNAPKGSGGWRVGFARAAVKGVSKGELARHLTEGALAGGGVQAIREGVELGKAKKTVKSFVSDRRQQLTHHTPQPSTTVAHGENVVKGAGVEPRPAGEF